MAHGIQKDDTMVSGMGITPWHGLGTVVEGAMTAEEAMRLANLNWEVVKTPLYIPNKDNSAVERVLNHAAIVRETDQKVLGVVGTGYQPIQNADMFGFFDSIVARGEAIYHTMGSLFGGRRVWALAKMPDYIKVEIPGKREFDDIVEEYILLTNTHDGTMAFMILPTNIRVVCNNTLSWALGEKFAALKKEDDSDEQKRIMYTIKHTANAADRIRQAAEIMGYANIINKELSELYNQMARVTLTEDERLEYFRSCLNINVKDEAENPDGGADDGQDSQEEEEKTPRRLMLLEELHETGAGAEYVRGSLWGAYNAITEAVDHNPNRRSPDSRLNNAWFGGDRSVKNRALHIARELVTV